MLFSDFLCRDISPTLMTFYDVPFFLTYNLNKIYAFVFFGVIFRLVFLPYFSAILNYLSVRLYYCEILVNILR